MSVRSDAHVDARSVLPRGLTVKTERAWSRQLLPLARIRSRLLFSAQFLEGGIGAQRVPD
jgi:hypothetical protein